MNWDMIKGQWHQMKGAVKAKWGEITDDEADKADGDREKMVGLVQKKYGVARDEAERQVDEWSKQLS